MSTRAALFLAWAAVFACGCSCEGAAAPVSDAGDAAAPADAAADASEAGADAAAVDASSDSSIDWPDASDDPWFCKWPRGPCPPERPYCCTISLKGPPECRVRADGADCLEWPSDVTTATDDCNAEGTQCPEAQPYCCDRPPSSTCAGRVLEGWADCRVDQ